MDSPKEFLDTLSRLPREILEMIGEHNRRPILSLFADADASKTYFIRVKWQSGPDVSFPVFKTSPHEEGFIIMDYHNYAIEEEDKKRTIKKARAFAGGFGARKVWIGDFFAEVSDGIFLMQANECSAEIPFSLIETGVAKVMNDIADIFEAAY